MACISFSSDFYAALTGAVAGGALSWLIQWRQYRREDRKAEEARKAEDVATAQTILFKLQHVLNVFHNVEIEARRARDAVGTGGDLWTRMNPTAHTSSAIVIDYRELHLLARTKQFELLNGYQEATEWLNNLRQSIDAYRTLYMQWSNNPPDSMDGQVGRVKLDESNRHLLPLIANLRSLSHSLEETVYSQTSEIRDLLVRYADAMFEMVGVRVRLDLDARGDTRIDADGSPQSL